MSIQIHYPGGYLARMFRVHREWLLAWLILGWRTVPDVVELRTADPLVQLSDVTAPGESEVEGASPPQHEE